MRSWVGKKVVFKSYDKDTVDGAAYIEEKFTIGAHYEVLAADDTCINVVNDQDLTWWISSACFALLAPKRNLPDWW